MCSPGIRGTKMRDAAGQHSPLQSSFFVLLVGKDSPLNPIHTATKQPNRCQAAVATGQEMEFYVIYICISEPQHSQADHVLLGSLWLCG